MRYWPSRLNIKNYKDRFMYLSGGKRKGQGMNTHNGFNFTGSNFMGSQLRSKIMNNMKI